MPFISYVPTVENHFMFHLYSIPVLLRHASVEELESPDTPYIKQMIKVRYILVFLQLYS